jgi:hypothetical protein
VCGWRGWQVYWDVVVIGDMVSSKYVGRSIVLGWGGVGTGFHFDANFHLRVTKAKCREAPEHEFTSEDDNFLYSASFT